MPLTPDQLPDDIAALKRMLLATTAELAAAKNGLIVTQLTIEKLKAQLAKLRREKFGSTSEQIQRSIEQLELALEDAEAAKPKPLQRSRKRTSRRRVCPGRRQRSWNRQPKRNRAANCPPICRVATSCTIPMPPAEPAAARTCARSARASPKCLNMCRRASK